MNRRPWERISSGRRRCPARAPIRGTTNSSGGTAVNHGNAIDVAEASASLFRTFDQEIYTSYQTPWTLRAFPRALDLPYKKQEITVNPAAAAALYEKLCEATEGYGGGVPVIHHAVAGKAVVNAIE